MRRPLVLTLTAGFVCLLGASTAWPAVHPLRVSPDRRHLVDANGAPFLYLADTAWQLFHRLTREEAQRYLEDRAKKGFTVVQAVALGLDGLDVPNAYGEPGLVGKDPRRPNEAYFAHVDWIVDKAGALGLTVGLLPTWGDVWHSRQSQPGRRSSTRRTPSTTAASSGDVTASARSSSSWAATATPRPRPTARSFAPWRPGSGRPRPRA
jgi:hypothetical protein